MTARAGLEVGPDGAEYLGVADRLADGHGFTRAFGLPGRRLDHYGPLLPALLAPAEVVGVSARSFAWVVHVLLFALDTVLVGVVTRRLTRGRLAPALVAGALFALTAALLVVYASVLSEPVYLTLLLVSVLLLADHLVRGRAGDLVGAAAFGGLAVLARFVGFAIVGTGGLAVLTDRERPWRRRLRDATRFGVVSLAPFAVWTVTARLGGAAPTDRDLEWHPISARQLGEAVRSVGSWVVGREANDDVQVLGAVLLAFGAVVLGGLAWRERAAPGTSTAVTGAPEVRALRRVLVLGAASHLAVIALTMWFADRTTPGSTRILAPVYVCLLPLAVAAADSVLVRRPRLAPALVVVVVALLGARAVDVARTIVDHDASRLRWAAPVWERSPTLRAVDRLPRETVVWSNAPDLVWFQTGFEAFRTATVRVTGYRGGDRVADADARLVRFRNEVARNEGVVVLFDDLGFRSSLASEAELLAAGFVVAERHDDGVLLRAP